MEEINQRGYYPFGFTVNLHKFFNRPVEQYDEAEWFFKNPADKIDQTFTAFGNFDRISFCSIEEFADYRKRASEGYTWLGNRQSIMLYAFEDQKHRCFGFNEGSRQKRKSDGMNHDLFGLVSEDLRFSPVSDNYLILTLFYVSGEAKASVKDYGRFMEYCRDAILAVAAAYNEGQVEGERIHCEVFGTFNSSEIAVIWTSNEFADIQYLVDNLRYMDLVDSGESTSRRVFISSHTFVAVPERAAEEMDTASDKSSDTKKGKALVQLAGRSSVGADGAETGYQAIRGYVTNCIRQYVEKGSETGDAEEERATHENAPLFCAGEYDVMMYVNSKHLPTLFAKNRENSLSFHNREFCRNFLSSTTRLFYTKEESEKFDERMAAFFRKEQKGKSLLEIKLDGADHRIYDSTIPDVFARVRKTEPGCEGNSTRDLFDRLRTTLERMLPMSSDLLSTMDLIYSDYIQCGTSSVDYIWINDFDTQFRVVLTALNKSINESINGETPSQMLEIIQKIFGVLQQQIYHIMDSGKLFFEEPRSHFSYTGQYDLLMHAYYGILKCLLRRLYYPVRPQSSLCPVINFASIPAIESELYLVFPEDGDPDRLLEIRLPYDTWSTPAHYVPMLIHELYHYATPLSRGGRNRYYAWFLMTDLHVEIVKQALSDGIEKAVESAKYDNKGYVCKPYLQDAADGLAVFAKDALGEFFSDRFFSRSADSGNPKHTDFLPVESSENRRKDVFLRMLLAKLEDEADGRSDLLPGMAAALQKGFERFTEMREWKEGLDKLSSVDRLAMDRLLEGCRTVLNYFAENRSEEDGRNAYQNECRKLILSLAARSYKPMCEILDELFPDVAMTTLTGLEPDEYMLQFAIHQNHQALNPEEISEQTVLRIGAVLDWIMYPNCASELPDTGIQRLEELRERFLFMYRIVCPESKKQRGTSGEAWFKYFEDAYKTYLTDDAYYRPWFMRLIAEEYAPCLEQREDGEDIKELKRICREYYKILKDQNLSDDKRKETLFWHTIRLIQRFHLQGELSSIQPEHPPQAKPQVSKPPKCTHAEIANWFKPQRKYPLDSENDLIQALDVMVRQLTNTHQRVFGETKSCHLWYRGCKNAKYDVLPSIMVRFFDRKKDEPSFDGRNYMGTLMEYQRYVMENFRFRAEGAPEFIEGSKYLDVDYLALMQHYSQPTALLDWSEDAYSSLYFALEKYIDGEPESPQNENEPAVLYILDPMLYNRARWQMMRGSLCRSCLKESACRKQDKGFCGTRRHGVSNNDWAYLSMCEKTAGYIPNLSIPANHKKYSMLFTESTIRQSGEKTYHCLSVPPETATLAEPALRKEIRNLPLAIYTARLNPRLRAQSGIFMAYNLRTLPAWNPLTVGEPSAKQFHYISLKAIQDHYLESFPDEQPFLIELVIHQDVKRELATTLHRLGLERYRIYPELDQLKYQVRWEQGGKR